MYLEIDAIDWGSCISVDAYYENLWEFQTRRQGPVSKSTIVVTVVRTDRISSPSSLDRPVHHELDWTCLFHYSPRIKASEHPGEGIFPWQLSKGNAADFASLSPCLKPLLQPVFIFSLQNRHTCSAKQGIKHSLRDSLPRRRLVGSHIETSRASKYGNRIRPNRLAISDDRSLRQM